MAWNIADVLMGIMAIVNLLPLIVILGKVAIGALDDYEKQIFGINYI